MVDASGTLHPTVVLWRHKRELAPAGDMLHRSLVRLIDGYSTATDIPGIIGPTLGLAPDDIEVRETFAPCAWCGTLYMDQFACPNAKDICIDCCGEDH